ncbi:TlpA family protein disulfide reductase [Aquipuribacter sp. MA13-6]|uniref:TlpA family protein disulfide reductase n=1 Tax=unclassified Aquipuribacter TaxID=2635084 RepID=UPI003EE93885
MDPLSQRLLLLVGVIAVVLVVGGLWRVREHRRGRQAFAPPADDPRTRPLVLPTETAPAGLGGLGRTATLVVVGTRSCSDCARTLALLRREVQDDVGVAVHHVLAERAPGLVDRFEVRTAPTVLLADADGQVVGVHPGPVDADVARQALVALAAGRTPFAAAGSDVAGAPDPTVVNR